MCIQMDWPDLPLASKTSYTVPDTYIFYVHRYIDDIGIYIRIYVMFVYT